VFDRVSGALYGHIVAGIPEGCIAYIIPAFKTFENIRQQIGTVQFASDIFAAEAAHDRANISSRSNPVKSRTPSSPQLDSIPLVNIPTPPRLADSDEN
jgi:hypothetical protein